jgi:hypothetical protein
MSPNHQRFKEKLSYAVSLSSVRKVATHLESSSLQVYRWLGGQKPQSEEKLLQLLEKLQPFLAEKALLIEQEPSGVTSWVSQGEVITAKVSYSSVDRVIASIANRIMELDTLIPSTEEQIEVLETEYHNLIEEKNAAHSALTALRILYKKEAKHE